MNQTSNTETYLLVLSNMLNGTSDILLHRQVGHTTVVHYEDEIKDIRKGKVA